MGEHPDWTAEELKPAKKGLADSIVNADQYGHDVSSARNFFIAAAPQETYLERVDRYIEYLKVLRPQGIIEIVLADDEDGDDSWHDNQTRPWGKLLKERGFKIVNDCLNSNSGNRCFVYHLNCE